MTPFARRRSRPVRRPLGGTPLGHPVPIVLVTLLALVALVACGSSTSHRTSSSGHPSSGSSTSTSADSTPTASTSVTPTAPASPTTTPPRRGHGTAVHVSLFEGDGQTYGVAMPIIAYFSVAPTDASTFDKAVVVRVNNRIVHGAWYFENSSQSSQAMEAHYRLATYWPAHAHVTVAMPLTGLWAGKGLVFDDSLTLSMEIGAQHKVSVNGAPGIEHMRVFSDGKLVRTLPVSLGKADTPTYLGTAVVMAKANPQHMVSAPGETPAYSIEVPWSVRVTYDGEFIHDAYWNGELGQANLSHGCTNLAPADAQWYYSWSLVGDPVTWHHTGTSKIVPIDDGWGDWNASWTTYQKGGLLSPDGPH